jgi:hypothetical protein
MDRFLIFALERSGSSSLAAALNRGLSVVQEPFSALTGDIKSNRKFRSLLDSLGYLPESMPAEPEDEFAYNRFHRLAREPKLCAGYLESLYATFTGIKHVHNTVSTQANLHILDWCLDHGVRIIFLTRKKLGQALLSRFLAQQANIHDLGPGMENRDRWEDAEFQPIDVDAFRTQLRAFKQAEREQLRYLKGKPFFYLTYEKLYQGRERRRRKTFEALCRFLSTRSKDLDQATLESYLFNPERKQTNRQAIERLPNARQLKRYL